MRAGRLFVSIPHGTIKRHSTGVKLLPEQVSIPHGTIKSGLYTKADAKQIVVSIPQGTIKRYGIHIMVSLSCSL